MAVDDGDTVLWGGNENHGEAWRTTASNASSLNLQVEPGPSGQALRFDFHLEGERSWVIARRDLDLVLPPHYVFVLCLRGQGATDELQLKLVDPSGSKVWWWRRRDMELTNESRQWLLRQSALDIAWGAAGDEDPTHIGAIELALAAKQGGAGTLWLDALRIERRPQVATEPSPQVLRVSSDRPGHESQRMLEAEGHTSWRPSVDDEAPSVEIDLGCESEWGGVVVDVPPRARVPRYELFESADGVGWRPLDHRVETVGRRSWLRVEAESRWIRLELAGDDVELAHLAIVPIELAVSPAHWASHLAHKHARGDFPRHLLGEQIYWAVVGGDGDEHEALLSEDGAIEVDFEGFTIEPFLVIDDRRIDWSAVESSLSLTEGNLPIPRVEWHCGDIRLRIVAFAATTGEPPTLCATYTVENRGTEVRSVRLLLALRPFQVTPSWQSVNLVGGVAPIRSIYRRGDEVVVNEQYRVMLVTQAAAMTTARSDENEFAKAVTLDGADDSVEDPLGLAQAVLSYDLTLSPSAAETVVIAVPRGAGQPIPLGLERSSAAGWSRDRLDQVISEWRSRLARLPIRLPGCAATLQTSLQMSVAWILINRDGPRIQPGSRAYRRSWIRDGALTATALAEMGFGQEGIDFFRWYAPYQRDDGTIPCAIDWTGVDPTPEHDSHAEFIWGCIELSRLTGDVEFLRELWPRITRSADAIERLIEQRSGDEHRGTAFFGLLPESVSHEGYVSNPSHSYWDDLWSIAALSAASDAARQLDRAREAGRFGVFADQLRTALQSSIEQVLRQHDLDFLPGSVERGDFDPSSTAIAFDPCQEAACLPPEVLRQTFERYWQEASARHRAGTTSEAYAPYELRCVVAFLRLGWKERALELLQWLLEGQRPAEWHQWPEIVWRAKRAPKFLGDLPHGWIASSFLRAVRRLIVDEAEGPRLVIAAGVPEEWARDPDGVLLQGLVTRFGSLDLSIRAESDDSITFDFGDSAARLVCELEVCSPSSRPVRRVDIDGRARQADSAGRVRLSSAPTRLRFDY